MKTLLSAGKSSFAYIDVKNPVRFRVLEKIQKIFIIKQKRYDLLKHTEHTF